MQAGNKQGTKVRPTALLALIAWAAPISAQTAAPEILSLSSKPAIEPDLNLLGSGFALPIIDYTAPDGTLKRSHGIIVGRNITPSTVVGLGLFSSGPKMNEPQDGPLAPAKKSKKVAVGLTFKF